MIHKFISAADLNDDVSVFYEFNGSVGRFVLKCVSTGRENLITKEMFEDLTKKAVMKNYDVIEDENGRKIIQLP